MWLFGFTFINVSYSQCWYLSQLFGLKNFAKKLLVEKKTNIGFSCRLKLNFVTEEICLVLKCTVDSIFTRLTFAHIRVYGYIPIYGHMSIHIYMGICPYIWANICLCVSIYSCAAAFSRRSAPILRLLLTFWGTGQPMQILIVKYWVRRDLIFNFITVLKKLFILAIWVTSNDDPGIL